MEYPNIAIASYNILWEIMEKDNHNALLDLFFKNNYKTMKKNLLANIQNVYDRYNPQIYCFQEAAGYNEIIKIFDKKKYSSHINKSGPEYMLTVWNNLRFKLKKTFDGEFESGRPFCILIFKDNLTKKYFALINLHAGHRTNTDTSIFNPIQKLINKNLKDFSQISRIILVGDFNRDINHENKSNEYHINIADTKYKFNYYEKPSNNTCCDVTGDKLKRNFDHVLDSEKIPMLRHELNKESWYAYPSSDHVMIMSILNK
jgi:hypothetical protein